MAITTLSVTKELHKQLMAVAPIFGVSIGNPSNKATWRIDFQPSATQANKDAAQSVIDAFDAVAENQQIEDTKTRYKDDSTAAKTEQAVQTLAAMTPAQAKNWVQTNVNTFADAKALLSTMAMVLCVLSRRL